ncbi:hypothetical protein CAEBREN_31995 [Caenorhabditis brenneri]|uniref:Serpentine receptor class gamma n=1 Tax=Caenorhabditis brenneri TaxID=135651 RepID=G0NWU5_CAEBE|nr:hypothetical protein CAEBREN_31995 [Caenorhabditis brenneri]
MLHQYMDSNQIRTFRNWNSISDFSGTVYTKHFDDHKATRFSVRLSLVLYRFTSVHFLTSDEKWKRWYSCVPVFGTLYSFAVLTPWWYFGPLVTTVKIVDGQIQKTIDKKGLFTHATINPVFSAFYFLMILLFGVWTTMRLEEKGQKSRSNRHKHFVKRLTRIIVCNSILMSGNLLLLIVIGIAYIFVPPASILQVQMIVVTFTSDMVTLAMPYILFTFDSNIRRLLKLEPSQIPIGMTSCTGRTITNYVVNN